MDSVCQQKREGCTKQPTTPPFRVCHPHRQVRRDPTAHSFVEGSALQHKRCTSQTKSPAYRGSYPSGGGLRANSLTWWNKTEISSRPKNTHPYHSSTWSTFRAPSPTPASLACFLVLPTIRFTDE